MTEEGQTVIKISAEVKEEFKKIMGWTEEDYHMHIKYWKDLLQYKKV